jgi:hypothetical protein
MERWGGDYVNGHKTIKSFQNQESQWKRMQGSFWIVTKSWIVFFKCWVCVKTKFGDYWVIDWSRKSFQHNAHICINLQCSCLGI